MTKINFFLSYSKFSKSLLSSTIFLIPFLIIYEFLSFFKFYNKPYEIRNTADQFLRDIFYIFFNNIFFYYLFLFTIFIFFILFKYKGELKKYNINPTYLIVMFVEGFLYGIMLLFLLNDYQSIYIKDLYY